MIGRAFARLGTVWNIMIGERHADRVVPPTGYTAWLIIMSSAVMALFAVFAVAGLLFMGKVSTYWQNDLASISTIQFEANTENIDVKSKRVLDVLSTTPGVKSARVISLEEQKEILKPWFGETLPIESLPVPTIIEIQEDGTNVNFDGLKSRLSAEFPEAILDTHETWKAPLFGLGSRVKTYLSFGLVLMLIVVISIVSLAAHGGLSANGQVIKVLRLIGAKDVYIVRAFVRRFTIRAIIGSVIGVFIGVLCLVFLGMKSQGGILWGISSIEGGEWLILLLIPIVIGTTAFFATRYTSFKRLRECS